MNLLTRHGVVDLVECRTCTLQIKDITQAQKDGKIFTMQHVLLFRMTLSDGKYSVKNNILAQPLQTLKIKQAQDLRYAVVKIIKSKKLENKKTGYKSASVDKMEIVSREYSDEIGKPQPYDSSKPLVIEEQEKIQAPPKKSNTSLPKPKPAANHTIQEFVSAPNQQVQNKKQNRSHSNPPIVKAQPRPKSRDIEKSQAGNFTAITQLFPNMDGWTIRVRLIYKSEVKTIRTRKGTDTQIFTVMLLDKDDSIIYGASFGQTATKLSSSLNINDIYDIRNAQVQQQLKPKPNSNVKVKLNLGDRTVISEAQDDGTIPLIEDKCKSVKQLLESPAGSFINIVCLVKQASQPQNFISKAGKPCTKRIIKVCDPVQKVATDITLWGDLIHYPFQMVPYAFYNVQAKQFNGNISFTCGFDSGVVSLKDHKYKKYKDLSKIVFSDTKTSLSTTNRRKINEIKASADQLTDDSKVWSEVHAYIAHIKTSGSMWYMSCPYCRKKVTQQVDSKCKSCTREYDRAKYRYILNIQIADDTDSLWVSMHNQQAQELLDNRTADDLQKMQPQDLKNLCNDYRDKQLICNVLTKLQKFQGVSKPRHNLTKLKKQDYLTEAKFNLKELKQRLK